MPRLKLSAKRGDGNYKKATELLTVLPVIVMDAQTEESIQLAHICHEQMCRWDGKVEVDIPLSQDLTQYLNESLDWWSQLGMDIINPDWIQED